MLRMPPPLRPLDYSHNHTNQLVTKKTDSSGQKPWVKGSLDEAGHVNLGAGPVAVQGDGSFEGPAITHTTTITAKDATESVSSVIEGVSQFHKSLQMQKAPR